MLYTGQVADTACIMARRVRNAVYATHFLNILPIYAVLNKEGMKRFVGHLFNFAFKTIVYHYIAPSVVHS